MICCRIASWAGAKDRAQLSVKLRRSRLENPEHRFDQQPPDYNPDAERLDDRDLIDAVILGLNEARHVNFLP